MSHAPQNELPPAWEALYPVHSALLRPRSTRQWIVRLILLTGLMVILSISVSRTMFETRRFEAIIPLAKTWPKVYHYSPERGWFTVGSPRFWNVLIVGFWGSLLSLPPVAITLGVLSRKQDGGLLSADVTLATILSSAILIGFAFFVRPSPYPTYWLACPYLLTILLCNVAFCSVRMACGFRDRMSILVTGLTVFATLLYYCHCVAIVFIAAAGA